MIGHLNLVRAQLYLTQHAMTKTDVLTIEHALPTNDWHGASTVRPTPCLARLGSSHNQRTAITSSRVHRLTGLWFASNCGVDPGFFRVVVDIDTWTRAPLRRSHRTWFYQFSTSEESNELVVCAGVDRRAVLSV